MKQRIDGVRPSFTRVVLRGDVSDPVILPRNVCEFPVPVWCDIQDYGYDLVTGVPHRV